MTGETPTVALLPWGNVIEDFLDTIGVSPEKWATEFNGGWLLGYMEALRRAGVRSVVVCVSAGVRRPQRLTHAPTGAPVWLLPSPRRYAALRRHMRNPYGWDLAQTFGAERGATLPRRVALSGIKLAAPYAATPVRSLARVLRDERCGAILSQEYEYARFDLAVVLGRALGLPVFASFQGGTGVPGRVEPTVRRRTIRAAAGLLIASGAEAKRVRERYGVPDDRIARVFNPLDVAAWTGGAREPTRRALGIPADVQVVVSHGRIAIHSKGLDVLAAAWAAVCAERPGRDLRLLLVGTGEDAPAFGELIRGLRGVTWVNRFVLDQTVMRDHVAAGDVYVMASRREGFPVAPTEAMACGLPVVAADASGIQDIFEDGERSGGVVVRREDACALAAALGRVLDDPALARALGAAARRRVEERFSLESVGEQLAGFLRARGLRARPG